MVDYKMPHNKLVIVRLVIISLLLILLGLVGFYWFNSQPPSPENVFITNQTSNSATVVWTTDKAVKAEIRLIDPSDTSKVEIFYDDRDIEEVAVREYKLNNQSKRRIHHVTLRNLMPDKEYNFSILLNSRVVNIELESLTTAKVSESVMVPDPVYGTIQGENLETLKEGIIIFHKESQTDKSQLISKVVNDGSYSIDAANLLDNTLEGFYQTPESIQKLKVIGLMDQIVLRDYVIDGKSDQPVMPIVLTAKEEGTQLIDTTVEILAESCSCDFNADGSDKYCGKVGDAYCEGTRTLQKHCNATTVNGTKTKDHIYSEEVGENPLNCSSGGQNQQPPDNSQQQGGTSSCGSGKCKEKDSSCQNTGQYSENNPFGGAQCQGVGVIERYADAQGSCQYKLVSCGGNSTNPTNPNPVNPNQNTTAAGCFSIAGDVEKVQDGKFNVSIRFVSVGGDGDVKLEKDGAHVAGWNGWNKNAKSTYTYSSQWTGSPINVSQGQTVSVTYTGTVANSSACPNVSRNITCSFNYSSGTCGGTLPPEQGGGNPQQPGSGDCNAGNGLIIPNNSYSCFSKTEYIKCVNGTYSQTEKGSCSSCTGTSVTLADICQNPQAGGGGQNTGTLKCGEVDNTKACTDQFGLGNCNVAENNTCTVKNGVSNCRYGFNCISNKCIRDGKICTAGTQTDYCTQIDICTRPEGKVVKLAVGEESTYTCLDGKVLKYKCQKKGEAPVIVSEGNSSTISGNWVRCVDNKSSCADFCASQGMLCTNSCSTSSGGNAGMYETETGISGEFNGTCDTSNGTHPNWQSRPLNQLCSSSFNVHCCCGQKSTATTKYCNEIDICTRTENRKAKIEVGKESTYKCRDGKEYKYKCEKEGENPKQIDSGSNQTGNVPIQEDKSLYTTTTEFTFNVATVNFFSCPKVGSEKLFDHTGADKQKYGIGSILNISESGGMFLIDLGSNKKGWVNKSYVSGLQDTFSKPVSKRCYGKDGKPKADVGVAPTLPFTGSGAGIAEQNNEIVQIANETVFEAGRYSVEGVNITTKEISLEAEGVVEYFQDLNKDGIRQDDEPLYNGDVRSLNIKFSKIAEAQSFKFELGWNLVSFPLYMRGDATSNVAKASELLKELNNAGIVSTHVVAYRLGSFVIFSAREGGASSYGEDFSILPGEGYFVKSYSEGLLVLNGKKIENSQEIMVDNGWNLVGIYNSNKLNYKGFEVLRQINSAGVQADILSKWDSGMYYNIVLQNNLEYGNDYGVYPYEGYFLRVSNRGVGKFAPN